MFWEPLVLRGTENLPGTKENGGLIPSSMEEKTLKEKKRNKLIEDK